MLGPILWKPICNRYNYKSNIARDKLPLVRVGPWRTGRAGARPTEACVPRPLGRSVAARARTNGSPVSRHTQALSRSLDRPDSLPTADLGVDQTFDVIPPPNGCAKARYSWGVLPARHLLAGPGLSGLTRHSGDRSANDG